VHPIPSIKLQSVQVSDLVKLCQHAESLTCSWSCSSGTTAAPSRVCESEEGVHAAAARALALPPRACDSPTQRQRSCLWIPWTISMRIWAAPPPPMKLLVAGAARDGGGR
jgi:hypothetical protein